VAMAMVQGKQGEGKEEKGKTWPENAYTAYQSWPYDESRSTSEQLKEITSGRTLVTTRRCTARMGEDEIRICADIIHRASSSSVATARSSVSKMARASPSSSSARTLAASHGPS